MHVSPCRLSPRAVLVAFLVVLSLRPALRAQSAPSPSADSGPQGRSASTGMVENTAGEPVVRLSAFDVSGNAVSRYQASESTSGTRVSTDLFDSTQSITVATAAFVADTGSNSAFAAAQYLPGIGPSTGGATSYERITVRGFQTGGVAFDGLIFASGAAAAGGISLYPEDTAVVDRIEVVGGPNAILNPNGQPGGTVNFVTKTPQFKNSDQVNMQVGRYATNRGDIDVNRVIRPDLAVRLVISGSRNTGEVGTWQQQLDGYDQSFTVLANALWRPTRDSELLIQYQNSSHYADGNPQMPLDPSAGTNTSGADVLRGLPRDSILLTPNLVNPVSPFGSQVGTAPENNQDWMLRYSLRATDALSVRVVAAVNSYRYADQGTHAEGPLITAPVNQGGAYDPRTGFWTPGYTYGPAPTYTPIPVPLLTAPGVFNETVGAAFTGAKSIDYVVQNDYAYAFATSWIKSLTTAGFSADFYDTETAYYTLSGVSPGTINVYNLSSQRFTYTFLPNGYYGGIIKGGLEDLYLDEQAKFLSDRIIVNVGLVQNVQYQTFGEKGYVNQLYRNRIAPLFGNYGVVIRPIPGVEAYYGHSGNALLVNNPPVAPPAPNPDRQVGKEDEVGMRTKFLDGKATATVAYYQIYQTNFPLYNPGNLVVPQPNPPLPSVLTNRVGRGWEYSANIAITKEWSFLGSYTNFRNRNAFDVPFRGTPEQSGAFWTHYNFDSGPARGLALGIGWVHAGKRPGDTPPSGVTPLSTVGNPIPYQPSFYLPAYSLVNVTASYDFDKHWGVRLFVDNLLNDKYLASSFNRAWVEAGTPINPRATLTFSY